MTNEERTALAGEYVLGTLTAAEREAVERALPNGAALQDRVRRWEARLAAAGDGIAADRATGRALGRASRTTSAPRWRAGRRERERGA